MPVQRSRELLRRERRYQGCLLALKLVAAWRLGAAGSRCGPRAGRAGLWETYNETPGGMWGIYAAKTREQQRTDDPVGQQLLEAFLAPKLFGYRALIDPEFDGTFTLRRIPELAWTTKSQYLVDAQLTGSLSSGLEGNGEDNLLIGNAGDNQIDGRSGHDTVSFQGSRGEYQFDGTEEGLIVRDMVEDRDGADTLVSIEVLRFTDREVSSAEAN